MSNSHATPAWDFEALVVDDEAPVRELVSESLRGHGLTVVNAQDGRAAIAALERSGGRFGLVVTDINMPGADGIAVLRAAKQANASAYVVIITGYASLDSSIQAVRLGAHDYLTKPFSLGQLDIIIHRIADRMALERENRLLASRSGGAVSASLENKLDAIERRLSRIEALLTGGRPV